jgi:hypothetical protein
VLVVVNASSEERRLALPTGFPPGTALLGRSALKESSGGSCIVDAEGRALFTVPARELVVIQVKGGR